MTMTLAEFGAAGTDCADLGRALGDALWSEEGYIGVGRVHGCSTLPDRLN